MLPKLLVLLSNSMSAAAPISISTTGPPLRVKIPASLSSSNASPAAVVKSKSSINWIAFTSNSSSPPALALTLEG